MCTSPRTFSTRALVSNPARLGRHRRFQAGAGLSGANLFVRHSALADASRPAWLEAPLFSRHQPQPAIARHAA